MKNTLFLIVTLCCFYCSPSLFAQGFGGIIDYRPPTKVGLPTSISISKPDLVITSFNLTSAVAVTGTSQIGTTTYKHYSVQYSATIRNAGTTACSSYNVDPFYSAAYLGSSFFMNECRQFGTLNAGASQNFSGAIVFRLPDNDHRSVKVKLEADSSCATEFLPSYNFVNESNETNNTSIILTVTIP